MHIETPVIINQIRNILFVQLLTVFVFARTENAPVIHRGMLRIWKTLNTPLLPIKSTKTNHSSNKFWEIDMTKFEP